jgi:hypothetical protein
MRAMIRVAYLRVYIPAGETASLPAHVAAPVRRALTVGRYGVWTEPMIEDAFVADWHDRRWVCPRHPRLRMLEGFMAFHESYPGLTASLLTPEEVVTRASAELEALYREDPAIRSHILSSSWHVPLRWFAGFDPAEREVVDLPDGRRTIRYRTGIESARSRLDDAIDVLEDAGFDGGVVDQVRDVVQWMNGFTDDAMVELDYGTVADQFSDGELAMDETSADVHASLDALRMDDFERAGAHYADAAGRWASVQALTYAN